LENLTNYEILGDVCQQISGHDFGPVLSVLARQKLGHVLRKSDHNFVRSETLKMHF